MDEQEREAAAQHFCDQLRAFATDQAGEMSVSDAAFVFTWLGLELYLADRLGTDPATDEHQANVEQVFEGLAVLLTEVEASQVEVH